MTTLDDIRKVLEYYASGKTDGGDLARGILESFPKDSVSSQRTLGFRLAQHFVECSKKFLHRTPPLESRDYPVFEDLAKRYGINRGKISIENCVKRWPKLGAGSLNAMNVVSACLKGDRCK